MPLKLIRRVLLAREMHSHFLMISFTEVGALLFVCASLRKYVGGVTIYTVDLSQREMFAASEIYLLCCLPLLQP